MSFKSKSNEICIAKFKVKTLILTPIIPVYSTEIVSVKQQFFLTIFTK